MGLYAYCVVPASRGPPAALRGVAGEYVRGLPAGGLCVWVGEMVRAPTPSMEAVRAHNAVAVAAMEAGVTPLPLRFGQWVGDAGTLEQGIAGRAGEYAAALERVSDAAEFGIRVIEPAAEARGEAAAASGRLYLERLAARRAARSRLVARLEVALRERIGELVRAQRVDARDSPHGVVSVGHLVALDRADDYCRAAHSLRADLPELRFLFSGPWPPYSFAP